MADTTTTVWHEHILAGRQYLKTAHNGLARPSVFTNELVFQLAAMAIENFLVGVWQCHRKMPTDHTLSGLVDGMALFCPLEPGLAQNIKELDLRENLCTLVPVQHHAPNNAEIREVLVVGRQVAEYAEQQVLRICADEKTTLKE